MVSIFIAIIFLSKMNITNCLNAYKLQLGIQMLNITTSLYYVYNEITAKKIYPGVTPLSRNTSDYMIAPIGTYEC